MYEVNRSVFIVIPRAPFWHWLNDLPDSHLDGILLQDLQEDANSYLVSACQNAEEVWDIFRQWFDIELSSIVTDLSSEPLQRETFAALNV